MKCVLYFLVFSMKEERNVCGIFLLFSMEKELNVCCIFFSF